MTLPQAKQTFAELMHTARKRQLNSKELHELSKARQTMRMFRRPISNRPIGKGKKARAIRNSEHNASDELTFKQAQEIATKLGHRLSNTGSDYKLRGHLFPSGYFTDSLDDAIATLRFEIRRTSTQKNPKKPVLIYGKVKRIEAVKSQNHICDAECKACGHRYFHEFTSNPKMYGLPDGSLLIKV